MSENLRDTVLEAIEASLEAQLNAVRKLRNQDAKVAAPKHPKRRSQMDMAYDVLLEAGEPLHLNEIVSRVNAKFSTKVDPDSLGSALTKRVVKAQRFSRPAKNTFWILEPENVG